MNLSEFEANFREWAMIFAERERSSTRAKKTLLRSLIMNTLFDVSILQSSEVNLIVRSLIAPKNTKLQLERYGSSTLPRPKIKLLQVLCILRRILGAPNLTPHKRSLIRRLYPDCFC